MDYLFDENVVEGEWEEIDDSDPLNDVDQYYALRETWNPEEREIDWYWVVLGLLMSVAIGLAIAVIGVYT